jgi:hypothetical protein
MEGNALLGIFPKGKEEGRGCASGSKSPEYAHIDPGLQQISIYVVQRGIWLLNYFHGRYHFPFLVILGMRLPFSAYTLYMSNKERSGKIRDSAFNNLLRWRANNRLEIRYCSCT